jgi:transmembrane sensor
MIEKSTISLIANKANLPEKSITEAMEWLVLTWSGEEQLEKQKLHQQISHWCNIDKTHEQAWQYISNLNSLLLSVPGDLAANSLRAADKANSRRQLLQAFSILVVSITVGPTLYRSNAVQSQLADLITSLGEINTHNLADNTELTLNTNTAINVDYNTTNRQVTLISGEFMVKTANDHLATHSQAARPFLVFTQEGEISPIGTQFNVRRTDEYSLVAVQSGKVMLTNKTGNTLLIKAGEAAKFTVNSIEKLSQHYAQHAHDWVIGKLVVEQMRVADFITELQRYRRGIIRTEPAVDNMRISGTFNIKNPEHVLTVFEQTMPVKLAFISKYWLTIQAKTL